MKYSKAIFISVLVFVLGTAAAGAAPLAVTPWVYGPVTIYDDGIIVSSQTSDVNNIKFVDNESPLFMIQANPTGSELQTLIRTFPISENDSRIQIASHAPAGRVNAIELINTIDNVTTNSLFFGDLITAFNNSGNDVNFRVSSDSNSNMLFIDGGSDAVGIGGSPAAGDVLSVYGDPTDAALSIAADDGSVTITNLEITGSVIFKGRVLSPKDGNRTISGDTIEVGESPYHRIDTEAGAASDNLCYINGGVTGQLIYLSSINTARDITVIDGGTCNIDIPGNIILDHPNDLLQLLLQPSGDWIGVDFMNNHP